MGKVKKAIAGGLAGGIAACAGFAISGEPIDQQLVKLALVFAGGFIAGFAGVYVAPKNEESFR